MSIFDRITGFEELASGTLGGDAGGDVVAIVEETVKTEIAEIQTELTEQAAVIEEIRDTVEEHDDAVEELQESVEGMESMLASGNFHGRTFANTFNRAQRLNVKLGGRSVDRCGVESLDNAGTAQLVARDGMESFMDTVKGYGKKAIEVIKHIFNAIINFFVGIFDSASKLQRRSEQLSERVEKTEKLKEKIKLGGWNVLFDYKKNGLNEGFEGWFETLGAIRGLSDVGSDANKLELGAFNTAYGKLVGSIKSDAKKDVKATESSKGDDKVLVGQSHGIRVHATVKDGTAKDLTDAAKLVRSLKVNFSTDGKDLTSGESEAKADKAKLKSVLADVKSNASQLRSDKVSGAFSKALRDKLIGSLNALKADDAEKAKEVNEKVALVRALYSSTSSVTQAITRQLVRTSGWALDGVAAHL